MGLRTSGDRSRGAMRMKGSEEEMREKNKSGEKESETVSWRGRGKSLLYDEFEKKCIFSEGRGARCR